MGYIIGLCAFSLGIYLMKVIWFKYLRIRYLVYIKYGFKTEPPNNKQEEYCYFKLTDTEYSIEKNLLVYFMENTMYLRNDKKEQTYFSSVCYPYQYFEILLFAHNRNLIYISKNKVLKLDRKYKII